MKIWQKLTGVMMDFFEILFIGAVVFLIIYIFVGQLLEVSGDSMYPTFKDKEQIIAEKFSIKLSSLKRGEVVIFKYPKDTSRLLIKRVIALPGEKIKIENGNVYVNNDLLSEQYLQLNLATKAGSSIQEGQEYVVPADAYILMGDHREKSTDSREWGPVKKELLVGRGLLVYYPINEFKFID